MAMERVYHNAKTTVHVSYYTNKSSGQTPDSIKKMVAKSQAANLLISLVDLSNHHIGFVSVTWLWPDS